MNVNNGMASKNMMQAIKVGLAGVALLSVCSITQAAPTVHFTDFINNIDRTSFNGFESIPNNGISFTGGNGPYIEDGISVEQINGDGGSSIWVTCTVCGLEGNFGWYPNGGDLGYTQITRSGGSDFENVGMLIGAGWQQAQRVLYELLNNGTSVLSGSFVPTFVQGTMPMDYLGFSGGGFDTIRLADIGSGISLSSTITDGHYQALSLDSIELSGRSNTVPEPGSLALLGLGMTGLAFVRRRKAAR